MIFAYSSFESYLRKDVTFLAKYLDLGFAKLHLQSSKETRDSGTNGIVTRNEYPEMSAAHPV